MCRRNQVLGLVILAFGLGLVAGCWLESEIVRNCCGIGLTAVGILVLLKK